MDEKAERIVKELLDLGFKIHTRFGPSMLERTYQLLLMNGMQDIGHTVEAEKDISFDFNGHHYERAFRIDLLIDNLVVVELKSVSIMHPVFKKQLGTYLQLAGYHLGLVMNFGMVSLKDGIIRVVNQY